MDGHYFVLSGRIFIFSMAFSEFEFFKFLKLLAEDKFAISNSTLISTIMTTKTFVDKNKLIVNQSLGDNLILFLHAVLKNESNVTNIDKELLKVYVDYIDAISNKYTFNIPFEKLTEILFVLLKNNLTCKTLIDQFNKESLEYEEELKRHIEYYKLKRLYDDNDEVKILNRIVEIKAYLNIN